jgi:hypothetical protein
MYVNDKYIRKGEKIKGQSFWACILPSPHPEQHISTYNEQTILYPTQP